jgi:Carboxypeptidase regulatory-like domain
MQTHFASRGCGTALILLVTFLVTIPIECALQPNLSGRVLDPSGTVIPDAHVDLYSGKDEWHATTNSAGSFSFPVLSPGTYDVEFTSPGFRKQIIQSMRIESSETAPVNITMQVETPADSCRDSFSRVTYVDATRESNIRGVVSVASHPGVTEEAGKKRVKSSEGPLSGATVSVLKSGSKAKELAVRTNENGEFDVANLEAGLYRLKAVRKGYVDFQVLNVRVRPGKTLQAEFSMRPSGYIVLCQ